MSNQLRILEKNTFNPSGSYVIYWMQQSQRLSCNHALNTAISLANQYNKNLLVYFLIQEFPSANLRHYQFMLQNIFEIKDRLKSMNIRMIIEYSDSMDHLIELSNKASVFVMDRGYLKIQKDWRNLIFQKVKCQIIQVESDVIIPVEIASSKEEYSAATLRPKIHRLLPEFLHQPDNETYQQAYIKDDFSFITEFNASDHLNIDFSVVPSDYFKSGEEEAHRLLENFIAHKLPFYQENRNQPALDALSGMSLYLHFGQISPLEIALKLKDRKDDNTLAYLEELIIRRELSMNFVFYNEEYDSFNALPKWAKQSLADHLMDERPYYYSLLELENAETHDKYWNSAQKEMMITGKMHGYMRMYWGKKILEWSEFPEDAYQIALYLNNKYSLDGRDPNGYAGVAWCFGKHDRPWAERSVFGKVRYMNANGLKRKLDIEAYVQKIKKM